MDKSPVNRSFNPPSAGELGAVQLVEGVLHVALGAELDDPLPAPDVVGVGEGHLASLPHEVLQVLQEYEW